LKNPFALLSAWMLTFAACCAFAQTPAPGGRSASSAELIVTDAWVRVTPGSDVAAAYLTLRNPGRKPVTVTGVESSAASMAMIHETTVKSGMSRMRPHEEVVVEAGQTVKLQPDGLHIMLHGLSKPLSPGDSVPLLIRLKDGSSLRVSARVRPLNAQ